MVDEKVIKRYAKDIELPVLENCCPTSGRSKRER
jgi:hypothetical protein